MKRYVRTFTDIYDTHKIRENTSWFDEEHNIEGYYDCDGQLVVITLFGNCEHIERNAQFLGFIVSQSDNFEELLTTKDFIRDNYVYIDNGRDFKRVACYMPDKTVCVLYNYLCECAKRNKKAI